MPFPRFVVPTSAPPPFAITKVLSMKHSCSSSAHVVGNTHQHSTQKLHRRLKAPMYDFVVRIALRQHLPLRTGVENPQQRFKDTTRGNRLSTRTPIRNVGIEGAPRKLVRCAQRPRGLHAPLGIAGRQRIFDISKSWIAAVVFHDPL